MKRLAELVVIVTRLWVCAAHVCLCHMSRTALGVTWNSAASKEVVLVDFGPRFARKMATASSQVSLVLTRLADWPEVWPDPGRCRRKSTSSISPMAHSSSPSVRALARSQAPPGVANVANASHATRPSMFLPADDSRVHWVGVWAIWVVLESLVVSESKSDLSRMTLCTQHGDTDPKVFFNLRVPTFQRTWRGKYRTGNVPNLAAVRRKNYYDCTTIVQVLQNGHFLTK